MTDIVQQDIDCSKELDEIHLKMKYLIHLKDDKTVFIKTLKLIIFYIKKRIILLAFTNVDVY